MTHPSTAEATVREFAAEYPTPHVLRAVALCEAGTLTWQQVLVLTEGALRVALQEVAG